MLFLITATHLFTRVDSSARTQQGNWKNVQQLKLASRVTYIPHLRGERLVLHQAVSG